MKINVLGTASLLSESMSPAYLINDNILIDMPNGILKTLLRQKIDFLKIDHLLITHFHGDHFFDVPFFLLDRFNRTDNTLNIYCSGNGKTIINQLNSLAYPDLVNNGLTNANIKFIDSDSFHIQNLSVKRIPVQHGNMKNCFSYIISEKNFNIGFSGDTTYCQGLIEAVKQCDVFICECTLVQGNENHMGIDSITKLSKAFPRVRFYTTHMSESSRAELTKNRPENVSILQDYMNLVF